MTQKPETAVATTKEEKFTEYVPFGAQDKIKLSVSIVQNLIAVKTKSGKTCTPNDAIKFIMMCLAKRLNPFESDAYLIGYDGKDGPTFSLITAHQAFLKRAELHPEYDGMESGVIIKDDAGHTREIPGDFYEEGQTVIGGWATVFFKNRSHPMSKRVRLKRFQKSFGVWVDDPGGMICKCAEADALRSSFPTMLGGLYLKEEMEAKQQEPQVSTPIFTSVESPPANAKPAERNLVYEVLELCKKDGITEAELIEFMESVGLADAGMTLGQVHDKNSDALQLVVDSWDDFSQKIKEVINK